MYVVKLSKNFFCVKYNASPKSQFLHVSICSIFLCVLGGDFYRFLKKNFEKAFSFVNFPVTYLFNCQWAHIWLIIENQFWGALADVHIKFKNADSVQVKYCLLIRIYKSKHFSLIWYIFIISQIIKNVIRKAQNWWIFKPKEVYLIKKKHHCILVRF